MTDLSLDHRTALPDALRVLVEEFPREGWDAHPGFGGLVQFWLERHQMFRKLMGLLEEQTQDVLDRRIDPERYVPALARYGGMFANELHGHHQIEDMHYFPQLAARDPRLVQGFEILDHDHHAIDPLLQTFAERANAVIGDIQGTGAYRDSAGALCDHLATMSGLLNRHLVDEEELVVPVVLKYGE